MVQSANKISNASPTKWLLSKDKTEVSSNQPSKANNITPIKSDKNYLENKNTYSTASTLSARNISESNNNFTANLPTDLQFIEKKSAGLQDQRLTMKIAKTKKNDFKNCIQHITWDLNIKMHERDTSLKYYFIDALKDILQGSVITIPFKIIFYATLGLVVQCILSFMMQICNTLDYLAFNSIYKQIKQDLNNTLYSIYTETLKDIELEDKQGNKIDIANDPKYQQIIRKICNDNKNYQWVLPLWFLTIKHFFQKSVDALDLNENSMDQINLVFIEKIKNLKSKNPDLFSDPKLLEEEILLYGLLKFK